MKILEMNKQWRNNQGGKLTKLLISRLLITLDQGTGKSFHPLLMDRYYVSLIYISINFNKVLEMTKKSRKNQGEYT